MTRTRRVGAALATGLAWWVALTALELALASSTSPAWVGLSAGLGAVAAVTVLLAHGEQRRPASPALRWLAWLIPVPAAVVGDTLRLAGLLARQLARRGEVSGRLRHLDLPAGEQPARATARRALATVLVGASPGSYVVDTDDAGLLVHELGGGRSRVSDLVRR